MGIKVLLIVPPVRLSQRPNRFPLGIGYIAAVLEKAGVKVDVLDLNIMRLSSHYEEKKIARSLDDVSIVGMGGMITMLNTVAGITTIIKKYRPEMPVIVGGPLASHFQDLILRKTQIDVLVQGEGEHVIVPLITAIHAKEPLHKIPGIWFRDKSAFFNTTAPKRIDDINTLPFPAYHLFSFDKYLANRGNPRSTDIIGSRGCPFHCSFCHRNFGNHVVFRSVENIMEEIKFLKYFYNIQHIHLEDELFVLRKEFVSEFCGQISTLDITWSACSRANTLDRDILRAMKASGCRGVMVGLESFSDDRLAEMSKGITSDHNEQICHWLNYFGLRIYPGLIIGMPGETKISVKSTVDACVRHRIFIDQWNFAFATPYPGTELYEWAKQKNKITDDWDYIQQLCGVGDTRSLTVNLTTMADNDLINLRNNAIKFVNHHISSVSQAKRLHNIIYAGAKKIFGILRRGQSLFSKIRGSKSVYSCVHKDHFRSDLILDKKKRLLKTAVSLVEIEVFSHCNRKCWFCPNSSIDRSSKNVFMDQEVYSKILRSLQEIDYAGMVSYSRYNEPLSDPVIFERLREARKSIPGALLHMNTNGDFLNRETIVELYKAGLRSLNVQVYFSDGEEYADIVAVKKMRQRIDKLGLPEKFSLTIPLEWCEYKLMFRDMNIKIYSRNFKKNGVDRGGTIGILNNNQKRLSPCLVPFQHIYIDYNGNVVPCCNIRSDYHKHKQFVFGDLTQPSQSIFNVFTSSAAVNWRKMMIPFSEKQYPCQNCGFGVIDPSPENVRRSSHWSDNQ